MTREQMIEAIYQKIAEKNFICRGCWSNTEQEHIECKCNSKNFFYENKVVMYGDVLDYYDKNIKLISFELDVVKKAVIFTDIDYVQIGSYWEKLREPIENQSDNCIKFVFDNLNIGQENN